MEHLLDQVAISTDQNCLLGVIRHIVSHLLQGELLQASMLIAAHEFDYEALKGVGAPAKQLQLHLVLCHLHQVSVEDDFELSQVRCLAQEGVDRVLLNAVDGTDVGNLDIREIEVTDWKVPVV